MFILNIIPAPISKKAVWYDPHKNDLVISPADVIGLIELQNPDNPDETTTIPMYMTSDHMGIYSLPQLDINFLEFITHSGDLLDIGKYTKQIEDIKALYKKIKAENPEVVEVEKKGNLTQIKRIIKNVNAENPTHED